MNTNSNQQRNHQPTSSPGLYRPRKACATALIALGAVMTGGLWPVLAEDEKMQSVTINDTRDMRFGEILVAKETGVEVYNTTGLNDGPADLWKKMDLAQIAKQFGARTVQQNGPHYWMMDSQTVSMGKTATFGGIEARLVAILNPAIVEKSVTGIKPYTVFMPKKTQRMVYAKGKPVFELIDPDGHIYVLEAHDEHHESTSNTGRNQTYEDCPRSGPRRI